jgi:hypothetical protein
MMSSSGSFQNAGNSESGSTSASASGRGPLAASSSQLKPLGTKNKKNSSKIEEVAPVDLACAQRSYLQSLER